MRTADVQVTTVAVADAAGPHASAPVPLTAAAAGPPAPVAAEPPAPAPVAPLVVAAGPPVPVAPVAVAAATAAAPVAEVVTAPAVVQQVVMAGSASAPAQPPSDAEAMAVDDPDPAPAAREEAPAPRARAHPPAIDPELVGVGHPFIFADPQQGDALIRALPNITPLVVAMEDVQDEGPLPMFVFGGAPAAPTPPPPHAPAQAPYVPVPHVRAPHLVAIPAEAAAAIAGAADALADAAAAAAETNNGFVFPNLDEAASAEPTDRHLNPHVKLPASAQREAAGPEDVGKVTKIQPNTGDFDRLVISREAAEENVHPDNVAMLEEVADEILYLLAFNAGRQYTSALPQAAGTIETQLIEHFGDDTITVIPVAAADPQYGAGAGTPNRYAPPIMYAVHVEDREVRGKMMAQGTCAIDKTFAYSLTAREYLTLSWAAGFFLTSIAAGRPPSITALRAALMKRVWYNAEVGRLLDRISWAHDKRDLAIRRYELSLSIDPHWNPTMSALVVYIKPCTNNALLWRELTNAICGEMVVKGFFIFKPLIDAKRVSLEPRCVICKNDDHFASACSFTHLSSWWGPPDQLSGLTEGPLSARGGRGRGGGRGDARGARGGQRGGRARGGRGRGGN